MEPSLRKVKALIMKPNFADLKAFSLSLGFALKVKGGRPKRLKAGRSPKKGVEEPLRSEPEERLKA